MRKIDRKRLIGLPVLATAALAASASPAGAASSVQILSYGGVSDIIISGSASADRVALSRSGSTVVVKTGVQPSVIASSGCAYVGFDGKDHVTHCPTRTVWAVTLGGGDDVFSASDVPGSLNVIGGDGHDNLSMARTFGFVEGNAGNDTITTWDGFGPNVKQEVKCGNGTDTVLANWGDAVGTGCENLTRK